MENSNNEETLLTITKMADGAAVEVHAHGLEDLMALTHAIASIGDHNPMFTVMLLLAMKEKMTNPEESKSEAVDVPDFNKILKNLN